MPSSLTTFSSAVTTDGIMSSQATTDGVSSGTERHALIINGLCVDEHNKTNKLSYIYIVSYVKTVRKVVHS